METVKDWVKISPESLQANGFRLITNTANFQAFEYNEEIAIIRESTALESMPFLIIYYDGIKRIEKKATFIHEVEEFYEQIYGYGIKKEHRTTELPHSLGTINEKDQD